MLTIVFMRHALFDPSKDALTFYGEDCARSMMEMLRLRGFQPDAIFTSPERKPVLMAQVYGEVLRARGKNVEPQEVDLLGSKTPFGSYFSRDYLGKEFKGAGDIICVTHEHVVQREFGELVKPPAP